MTETTSASVQISSHSMAVAALSTVVEWYDFTLYLYFATVLARVFFGGEAASLDITLAGFAISWLLRPLGAFYFGRIGDRYGRRRMLLISMALVTGTMLLTSLLPTYQQAGPAVGVMLIFLRGIMAFSVGGEYTGVVAYLLEGSSRQHRGLVTSLASAASGIGALLATGVSALTVRLTERGELDAWGWRIPFVVGFTLASVLWLARTRLEESPAFACHQRKIAPFALRISLVRFRYAIGRAFAISALGSVTYYLGITYVPAFLVSTMAFSEEDALSLSVVAALAVIIITPCIGWLSDRIGRRPVLLFLATGSLVIPLPVFWLMSSGHYLSSMAGAVVLACLAGSVSAAGAPSTAELFPLEGRLTGLAVGTTAATSIFGGMMPYLAQVLTTHYHSDLAPGFIIVLVALGVFPVFLKMPETAPDKSGHKPQPENARDSSSAHG